MAIAHINHVRQSKLTEYFLQNFKYSVAGIEDWELSINSATIRCIRIYAHSPNSSLLYQMLRVLLREASYT